MKHPVVTDFLFDLGMDCPINTDTLRGIFEIFAIGYSPKTNKFSAGFDWGVRIEDQHDDESSPHYVLQVGEGDTEGLVMKSFYGAYCDFHSTYAETRIPSADYGTESPKYAKNPRINHNPGQWRIYVWLPEEHTSLDAGKIAQRISDAYEQAMIDALPNYEILASIVFPIES